MLDMILLAAKIALPSYSEGSPKKNFLFGGIGFRTDGVKVYAKNGAVMSTQVDNYLLIPSSHCEWRLANKLDRGAVIYLARISKKDHSLVMARPCGMCAIKLRSVKVERVYYSIDPEHYGIFFPMNNDDKERIICCR